MPPPLVTTVERVSDGDTLMAVADDGTKLRIHLLGVDTPEVAHGRTPA
jgi:endonuclease YncB( thermonuclease family)